MITIPAGYSRSITVSQALTEGLRHRNAQQPSQDSVLLRAAGDFLFCGIADGQSGTRYGAEGGRACLEAVFEYLESAGPDSLIHGPFPDELPCMVVRSYRQRLIQLSRQYGADFKEFASTLLVIVANLRTGEYLLLHLGDGCAISIPRAGEPAILSGPDTGLTACHTWLTTSDHAVNHLRVRFGSLENKKRLLILSDGATCFCRGTNILWRTKELLKNGTSAQLRDRLLQSAPIDDAACLILDLAGEDNS